MSQTIYSMSTLETPKKMIDEPIQTNLWDEHSAQWGDGDSITLLDHENTPKVITRHVEPVIGLMNLGHKNTRNLFISVSMANDIQISNVNGHHVGSLLGHTDRIAEVKQMTDGTVVSISQNGEIKFWDVLTQTQQSEINAEFTDYKQVNFFSRTNHLSILDKNGVGIWRYNGECVLDLPNQKSQIKQAFQLNSDNWLIKTEKERPQLWSNDGKCLSTLSFDFAFDTGVIELDDNTLLIKNSQEEVGIYDSNGKLTHVHVADTKISELFVTLVTDDNKRADTEKQKPSIKHYHHVRNLHASTSDLFVPAEILSKEALKFKGKPLVEKVWNFFNRPLFSEVKMALVSVVKHANNAQRDLSEHVSTTETLAATANKKFSLFSILSKVFLTLFVLIGAGGVALLAYMEGNRTAVRANELLREIDRAEPEVVLIAPGIVLFVLFIVFVMKKRGYAKERDQYESNLAVLNQLQIAFGQTLANVARYRRELRKQIPILMSENKSLFRGEFIREHTHKIIHEKLKKMAMDECGLQTEDITSQNQDPIILPGWSLIQDEAKRKQAKKKLVLENELSFWPLADHSFACAVQYIQYTFLTADKIDVFTCYYDFISDKCFAKEANAFYYKDVTNIVKRDVERDGVSLSTTKNSQENDFSANEIVLSVSSGERIRLTILNEETMSMINTSSKQSESESAEVKLRQIDAQALAIKNDETLSEEDRKLELALNEAERASLDSDEYELSGEVSVKTADQAISNIRSRLNTHKKE
jgi:hypothetical protein